MSSLKVRERNNQSMSFTGATLDGSLVDLRRIFLSRSFCVSRDDDFGLEVDLLGRIKFGTETTLVFRRRRL